MAEEAQSCHQVPSRLVRLSFTVQARGSHCRILQVCASILEDEIQPLGFGCKLSHSLSVAKGGSWLCKKDVWQAVPHIVAAVSLSRLCRQGRNTVGTEGKERTRLWSPLTLHNEGLSSALRCVPTGACVQLGSSYDFVTLLMQPIRPL